MAKKEQNRFTVLAPDIGSPGIMAAIDKALADNLRERSELLGLREMAIQRYGSNGDAPANGATLEVPKETRPTNANAAKGLTVAELVEKYLTDKNSSLNSVRFQTKITYKTLLRRIERDIGSEQIRNIDAQRLKSIHESWMTSGSHMAFGLIRMLRGMATFGATVLENEDCIRLRFLISQMQLKPAQSQSRLLTKDQVKAVISQAHAMGLHSIALAQVFQFECGLRQRDVIGEWVPENEPGDSDIRDDDGMKWIRGLLWSEIDNNLVLHHTTSWNSKLIEPDLSVAPLVMAELKRLEPLPKQGPVIVFEKTGLPYRAAQFRNVWREVATAAGLPTDVKNGGKAEQ